MRRLFLAFLFVPVACSIETENCTDVNQDKIYQLYLASYAAPDDTTSVSAQFRFGGGTGTTLRMDGNCSITHDAINLSKTEFLGTSYDGSKAGYRSTNVFTFVNNKSQTFTNTITNSNAIAFSSPPTTLSRASGVTLNFTPAIGPDDSVYLTIARTSPPSADTVTQVSSSSSETEGSTSITIAASSLSSLSSNGAVTLQAIRTYRKSLDQASASEGGAMSFTYYSTKASATLGD